MQFVHFKKRVDDDEDVQIEEDGLADPHQNDEEGDRQDRAAVAGLARAVAVVGAQLVERLHLHGPARSRHGLHQRRHRVAGVPVVHEARERRVGIGVVDVDVLEQRRCRHAEHVEDDDERDGDVDDLRHGVDDGLEEAVEPGVAPDHAQDDDDAHDFKNLAGDARQKNVEEGGDDDEEIEELPRVLEEARRRQRGEGDDDLEAVDSDKAEVLHEERVFPVLGHARELRHQKADVEKNADDDEEVELPPHLRADVVGEVDPAHEASESARRRRRRSADLDGARESEIADPRFLFRREQAAVVLVDVALIALALQREGVEERRCEEVSQNEIDDEGEGDEVDD